ncbi:MAG: hypothetical protein WCQ50_14930 [Spirochaetota bacterium]
MNTQIQHLDEARSALIETLMSKWAEFHAEKLLIIEDAFGRFTLGVWGKSYSREVLQGALDSIAPFGSGSFFEAPSEAEAFDPLELATSWKEARTIDDEDLWSARIRLIVRYRMLPGWQRITTRPLWAKEEARPCPLVTFYSFKGGMGRTTALSLFALSRSILGENVVVVDCDLDAPGLGSILAPESPPPYGVVDYLIEAPVLGKRPDDLRDYSYLVDLGKQRTAGSLRVFPSGRLDGNYLGKMARLDFETDENAEPGHRHPLEELLIQIRENLSPDWILVDSRTGFSETAGMLLSGMCDFQVLFGVHSEQSWDGLTYAIRKIGAERVERGIPQADSLVIHAMVPELRKEERDALLESFAERSRDIFSENYYSAPEADMDEAFWYLDEAGGESSPDHPLPISYSMSLSQSASVPALVDILQSSREVQRFCEVLAAHAGGEPIEARP